MDAVTKNFIDNLDVKSVPWHRMVNAYGTAEHYPELLSELEQITELDQWEKTYNRISDFEHQTTMFFPAPFALVFLVRILSKLLKEGKADDIAEKMLKRFMYYVDVCIEEEHLAYAQPLEHFSDLLDDENLLSENFTEEELIHVFEDPEAFSDELYYSCYHYSLIVLSQIPDILDQYGRFPEISKEFRDKMGHDSGLSE